MELHITQQAAGHTAQGFPLHLFELCNRSGVAASIAALGAALQALRLPDRHGRLANVVAGHGPAPGIHAMPAAGHSLHRAAWHAAPSVAELAVGLRLVCGGPPAVTALYCLNDAGELALDLRWDDAPPAATLCLRLGVNLAAAGDVRAHLLAVQAARCVPAGGALRAVDGSHYDCRVARSVADWPQPVRYLLAPGPDPVLRLVDPLSGRWLELLSNGSVLSLALGPEADCLLLSPEVPAGAGRIVLRVGAMAG